MAHNTSKKQIPYVMPLLRATIPIHIPFRTLITMLNIMSDGYEPF